MLRTYTMLRTEIKKEDPDLTFTPTIMGLDLLFTPTVVGLDLLFISTVTGPDLLFLIYINCRES